jgi:hypothetical protein
MYLRAVDKNETFSKDTSNYYQFNMTGKIVASGNIMTLLDKTGNCDEVPAYGFFKLFDACSSLISTPKLPALKLNTYCYAAMFKSCNSLLQLPKLPATDIADNCYNTMFRACNSLIDISKFKLPAENLKPYCYAYMFFECNSLENAQLELNS